MNTIKHKKDFMFCVLIQVKHIDRYTKILSRLVCNSEKKSIPA